MVAEHTMVAVVIMAGLPIVAASAQAVEDSIVVADSVVAEEASAEVEVHLVAEARHEDSKEIL